MKNEIESQLFVFGGCYSNLQATEQIKQLATNLGFRPKQIICTGDIVGYCAQPEETVKLINDWNINVIAGNVEVQLREGALDCGCNFDEGSRCDTFSRKWFPYAQEKLSVHSIDWMKQLPNSLSLEQNGNRIHVLHGGTDNISEFIFASTPINRKRDIMEQTGADIIIAGHSGIPFIQEIENANQQPRLWVNAGVIGMPANDSTPRCWYAIVDTCTKKAKLYAFEYDHHKASDLMIQNELPIEYAHTLRTGIWDNCEILPKVETDQQGIPLFFN